MVSRERPVHSDKFGIEFAGRSSDVQAARAPRGGPHIFIRISLGSNSPAGRLTYKQLVRHVVGLNAAPGQAIKLQPEDMIDHGDFVADQVACADRISAIHLG